MKKTKFTEEQITCAPGLSISRAHRLPLSACDYH